MEDFYKRFLEKNSRENRLFQESSDSDVGTTLLGQGTDDSGSQSESDTESARDPTKIVFENESLKLIVVRSQFKRQTNFKLGRI